MWVPVFVCESVGSVCVCVSGCVCVKVWPDGVNRRFARRRGVKIDMIIFVDMFSICDILQLKHRKSFNQSI